VCKWPPRPVCTWERAGIAGGVGLPFHSIIGKKTHEEAEIDKNIAKAK